MGDDCSEVTSAKSPSATSLTCSACVSCALTCSRSLDILDRAVLVCIAQRSNLLHNFPVTLALLPCSSPTHIRFAVMHAAYLIFSLHMTFVCNSINAPANPLPSAKGLPTVETRHCSTITTGTVQHGAQQMAWGLIPRCGLQ